MFTALHAQGALTVDAVSKPMTKKERDTIKERYTVFNEEMERIQSLQQEFSIPNKVTTLHFYFAFAF